MKKCWIHGSLWWIRHWVGAFLAEKAMQQRTNQSAVDELIVWLQQNAYKLNNDFLWISALHGALYQTIEYTGRTRRCDTPRNSRSASATMRCQTCTNAATASATASSTPSCCAALQASPTTQPAGSRVLFGARDRRDVPNGLEALRRGERRAHTECAVLVQSGLRLRRDAFGLSV